MNKKLLLSLISLLTISFYSCSDSNDDVVVKERVPIGFDINAGKGTRGLEMTQGLLKNTGFGVFGYYTEDKNWDESFIPNFMYNQKIEHSESDWIYSPLKYWPNIEEYKISFFAYAPYEKTPATGEEKGIILSSNTDKGTPKIHFTTKNSPAEMIDFITAASIDQSRDMSSTNGSIKFKFMHELTRVNFKVKSSHINSIINIKDAGISFNDSSNLYLSADYTFPNASNQHGTWNYENGTLFKENYPLIGILNISQDVNIGVEGKPHYQVDGILIEPKQSVDIFNGKYLFFIPVENGRLKKNSVIANFSYDIITLDSSLDKGYSSVSSKASIALPEASFVIGKSYTFVFDLDNASIDIEDEV